MKVPLSPAFAQVEVKKSRFIAFAQPLDSLSEIKQRIIQAREEHPGSRHVVHAAVVGPSGDEYSLSDDGEPKGTSGRPSLEVLKGSGVTNVLVLVVRYFGGTKLGTGGLVKAYGNAVKAVLEELKTEELVEKVEFTIKLTYPDHQSVSQLFAKEAIDVVDEDFAEAVTVRAKCPKEVLERVEPLVRDLTRGCGRIIPVS